VSGLPLCPKGGSGSAMWEIKSLHPASEWAAEASKGASEGSASDCDVIVVCNWVVSGHRAGWDEPATGSLCIRESICNESCDREGLLPCWHVILHWWVSRTITSKLAEAVRSYCIPVCNIKTTLSPVPKPQKGGPHSPLLFPLETQQNIHGALAQTRQTRP